MPLSFTEKVQNVVRSIPSGETMTYKQVAKAAGSPNAFRAVGNIMAHNCDPNIPCHRVTKSDGSPGGYAFGSNRKKQLLHKEKLGHTTFKERSILFKGRKT